MFRTLVANTAILSSGQIIVGLFGLLTVPVLIKGFGLYEYGLILLARLFLPNSFMAILDLGAIENTSQAVARAREGRDKTTTQKELGLLLYMLILIGIICAGVIYGLTPFIVDWLNVDAGYRPDFSTAIIVTVLSLPLLYPLQMAEGVLRGLEKYAIIKIMDVLTAVLFLLGSIICVAYKTSYITVVYVYLLIFTLKFLVLSLRVITIRDSYVPLLTALSWSNSKDIVARIKLMTGNRVLGIVINHLPVVAISAFLSPVSVSIYETLNRIPRFLKAFSALASSAVYSLSARLYQQNDEKTFELLSRMGMRAIAMLAFPFFTGCAVFAREILHFWIGGEIVEYWPLLSILLIVPLVSSLQFFISQSNLVKKEFIELLNKIALLQAVVFWILVFVLFSQYQIGSFIYANVASVLVAFIVVLVHYVRSCVWMKKEVAAIFSRQMVSAIVIFTIFFASKDYFNYTEIPMLIAAMFLWIVVYVLITYFLIMSSEDKAYLKKLAEIMGIAKVRKHGY